MKLTIGVKLFITYFVITSAIVWFVTDKVSLRVTKGIDEAAEDVMVDTANLLAQVAGENIIDGHINTDKMHNLVDSYLNRELNAKIYSVTKNNPNLQVYITNKNGIVIYDSTGIRKGKDYSLWNDVYDTLRGRYGKRSSAIDPSIKNPSPEQKAMYVSAPIYHNKEIFGVLTTIKPTADLKPYIMEQKKHIEEYAIYLFLVSLLFGAGASFVVSRGTGKLVKYTTALSKGENAVAPKIRQVEFSELARAIEKLRVDLEGREYVEEYINTMAHELRTPITGIKATAENLLMPMSSAQREHFVNNILDANKRMDMLVNRLLNLSRIERRDQLENIEKIDVKTLIKDVVQSPSRKGNITRRGINVQYTIERKFTIKAEKLLVEQALANIVDNAIDFTPINSIIGIKVSESNTHVIIQVYDQGKGVPEHARKQIFRRFFSSSRPDTGKRGNGLGLRFVKKIMNLHNGTVSLKNRFMEDGAVATLKFPIK
ncbi:two-component system sensor histidine kinase CreC [Candidatus Thioglobus sp.]|jgi:two-component system sensor histidine kinase CreC|uniref:two-component system sensor histidine kinase CreC n=1 Tax=Candidatus Thioglobus sp. TaxID=2026721 RepID=UPI001D9A48E5|nr:two-component system sensor histidine kinase CreC [Candidatus Thioglobus sp.]MBT3276937.1 two-component system sensor histidine kinase CreC [Candidatus Thioglobus sp.]MBT3446933.1 two-component system sensor histidine kinase CreC [Candidatus Thioglobus sp.]MBT4001279.1 two-component system sensor histidine kinase CreC [Candidatus Thioglobus sp.]MBT4181403.1 two-component system sensor histidine kinase CreC [Candidatus Thioglobus sp.]MBT4422127.1 two-component system sensor histidine kinase 